MEIQSECEACLRRLVELTVTQATAAPALQEQARRAALEVLAREFKPGAIPARIANLFHHTIMALTGNPDPFAARKAAETTLLGRMYRKIAPSYGNDLASLLSLAAAGNVIDFFRYEDEVIRELAAPVSFELSELERFRSILAEPPGLLLYLADNAGEQFFDQPLVAHFSGQGWRVLYVVKAGPIQNDLTREDLYASGLGPSLEPLTNTGARTVGLELERASPAFRNLFAEAQLILAKGMGHFETLSHLPDPRLFFLLQAKCVAVARALGVPRSSFVFSRSPAISLDSAGPTGYHTSTYRSLRG